MAVDDGDVPWEPDVPYYKSDKALAPLRPPAPAEGDAEAERLRLQEETKLQLNAAVKELVALPDTADALTIRRLAVRVQKLRVAVKVFEGDDDDLGKEIGLLNRVIAGDALNVPTLEDNHAEQVAALKERGVDDPTSAARLARILEAIMGAPDAHRPAGLPTS